MKITAAMIREKAQPFVIEEVEIDEPRSDEVLVKIAATGICHTDLIVRDQWLPVPLPIVLGHEGAGVVERVGQSVTKVQPGDHVVLTYGRCGQCVNCLEGRPYYCLHAYERSYGGGRADGSTALHQNRQAVHSHFFAQSSFATYALANEGNVVKVRQDVPLDILGPLGCGIQTGAGAVMNGLRPHVGSSIAVFGVGSVGLSAIMAARVVGCTTIIGIDVKPSRLTLAKELGATHTIHGGETDAVEEIKRITGGGAHYTLEMTASPRVLRQAVDALQVGGVCGVIGAAAKGTEVRLEMTALLFGRAVRGIRQGESVSDSFIPQLIELYMQGRFPFDRLIEFFSFDQINQAAEDTERGAAIKPVLRMPG
jgi:aryl-alcohol dehydrogenase